MFVLKLRSARLGSAITKAAAGQPQPRMPFPTRQEVHDLFKLLESPPDGTKQFFDRFTPDTHFIAVGPPGSKYAAHYTSKADYFSGGFAKLSKAVQPPGLKFRLVNGIDSVTVDEQRGLAAIMMDTVDTFTHSGVEYKQHYSWHLRFNEDGMVVETTAYLDHGYLDAVLGAELRRLGIE